MTIALVYEREQYFLIVRYSVEPVVGISGGSCHLEFVFVIQRKDSGNLVVRAQVDELSTVVAHCPESKVLVVSSPDSQERRRVDVVVFLKAPDCLIRKHHSQYQNRKKLVHIQIEEEEKSQW